MWRSAQALALMALVVSPWSALRARVATAACANPELPATILGGSGGPRVPAVMRTIVVGAPKAQLRLAVADTDRRRELGLMCVTALRPAAGMIFLFADGAEHEFWMKNTVIALDMLWVGADGRVTSVAARVPASTLDEPEDRVARRSGHGRYVIELAAGEAQHAGITTGTRLIIPALHATD